MTIWAQSRLCREAAEERARADADLARDAAAERAANRKIWQSYKVSLNSPLVSPERRRRGQIPPAGTKLRGILDVLRTHTQWQGARSIAALTKSSIILTTDRLLRLFNAGFLDRQRNGARWFYRLSPAARRQI